MEDSLPYEVWAVRMASYTVRTGKCAKHISAVYKLDLARVLGRFLFSVCRLCTGLNRREFKTTPGIWTKS
jgi:hypothetical protein